MKEDALCVHIRSINEIKRRTRRREPNKSKYLGASKLMGGVASTVIAEANQNEGNGVYAILSHI